MGLWIASTSWLSTWSQSVLIEANRFWFYALAISLLHSLFEIGLLLLPALCYGDNDDNKHGTSSEKHRRSSTTKTIPSINLFISRIKSIVVDGCDILIPGSFLRWIPGTVVGPMHVGVATVISTVVTARDVWVQLNRPT
jgi:Peroxisomal biogenesis factor 11 (PEX11)